VLLSSGTFEAMELTRKRIERALIREHANSLGLFSWQVQLVRAIGYFREAIRIDPNNAEARLRLAWLLYTNQSLEFDQELTLLNETRALAPKAPLSYLAALFAGRIQKELKHLDAAAGWYRTAIAECPLAQTARVGLSHVQLDQNQIVAARNTLRPLSGGTPREDGMCEPDPWRIYEFGQSWRLSDWITAMRKFVREPAESSQP
jgi:tetratricopeptide (TPR) repeat protein